MGDEHLDQVARLIGEAADKLDHRGSFRLRVPMLVPEKERAEDETADRSSIADGSTP